MAAVTGSFQIMQTHVLQHLMGLPGDAMGAIKELVDNALDADATHVWLVIEPNKFIVQDNGHGMVPAMSEESYALLQMFKEELAAGKEPDDIRDILDDPSAFSSFTWAMECVGFSGKKRFLDPSKHANAQQGMRGIGALAFNLIGDHQVWYSKPRHDLAGRYYGAEEIKTGGIPIVRLSPPSRADIQAHRLTYSYEVTTERFLREPVNGQVLPGGTTVEITEIRPGVERTLTTPNLAEYLKKLYGKKIREGAVQITIVDQTDGKKVTDVEGTHYEGALLMKATFNLKISGKHKPPFKVELYYNERGGPNGSPDLIRAGLAVSPFTMLREFKKQPPWDAGKVIGYVEFPALPADLETTAWDTTKTSLLESRVRTLWVEMIKKEIVPKIQSKILEIQSRAQDSALAEAFKKASEATAAVIQDIPALQALEFQKPLEPTKGTTPRPPKASETIRVSIIDENSVGVPDVKVLLLREGKPVLERSTTMGGGTSFGKPRPGNYEVRITLPVNSGYYAPTGRESESFEIKTQNEGHNFVFHVITGRQKPQREEEGATFRMATTSLDPEIPYSLDRMANGLLQLNSEGTAFRNALDAGDETLRNMLIAEYISAALAEWGLADYPAAQQHLVRCQVFSALVTIMLAKRRRR